MCIKVTYWISPHLRPLRRPARQAGGGQLALDQQVDVGQVGGGVVGRQHRAQRLSLHIPREFHRVLLQ